MILMNCCNVYIDINRKGEWDKEKVDVMRHGVSVFIDSQPCS